MIASPRMHRETTSYDWPRLGRVGVCKYTQGCSHGTEISRHTSQKVFPLSGNKQLSTYKDREIHVRTMYNQKTKQNFQETHLSSPEYLGHEV